MGRYVGSVLLGLLLGLVLLAAAIWAPRCAHAQATSWPLAWTAPGDDGAVGTAANTFMFWSSTTPDTTGATAWLDSGGLTSNRPAGISTWINSIAKNRAGPTPLPAGSLQTYAIQDTFPAGVKQWSIVRTCDDGLPAAPGALAVPNCSYSNLVAWIPPVVDTRAPGAVRDLRTRAEAVSP